MCCACNKGGRKTTDTLKLDLVVRRSSARVMPYYLIESEVVKHSAKSMVKGIEPASVCKTSSH